MKTVSIHDAKTNLSKYIAAAKRGVKVYIGSFGKPEVVLELASLTPFLKRRDFTIAKGKINFPDKAFSEETDAEIARLMLGEDTDELRH